MLNDILMDNYNWLIRKAKEWESNDHIDLVHDVYIQFINTAHRYDIRDNPKPILITFLRNRAKEMKRKEHTINASQLARGENNVLENFSQPGNRGEREDFSLETQELVDKLPAKEKQIIEKTFLEGLNEQQIADELGVSVSTVSRSKVKGLKALGGFV